jgi:hypothetical protein
MVNLAVEFGALPTHGPVPVSGGSQIGPPVGYGTLTALFGFSDLDVFYFGGCKPGELAEASKCDAMSA